MTVSGKYEPPFTVASFATTTHSRPSITPMPVTMPADGAAPSYSPRRRARSARGRRCPGRAAGRRARGRGACRASGGAHRLLAAACCDPGGPLAKFGDERLHPLAPPREGVVARSPCVVSTAIAASLPFGQVAPASASRADAAPPQVDEQEADEGGNGDRASPGFRSSLCSRGSRSSPCTSRSGSANAASQTRAGSFAYNGLIFSAAVVCLVGAPRRERLAWSLIALAVAAWAAGNTYWTFALVERESPPYPSISDAFWLAFYPPVYLALILLMRASVVRFRTSLWVDGAIGAARGRARWRPRRLRAGARGVADRRLRRR